MQKILLSFITFLLVLTAQSQLRYFYTELSGANEVPANASAGSGVAIVKLNTTTKVAELYGNYRGMTGTASVSHIHAGAAGVNGGFFLTLTNTGGNSGTLTGAETVDATEEAALFAGNAYVNVHSTSFGGGELRGQLTAVPEADAVFLNARLQGAQEPMPSNSQGSGSAAILLNRATKMVFLTGSYTNLSANVTVSHIHQGIIGVNGGVTLTLTNSGGISGTLHGAGTMTVNQADSLEKGHGYVNVHSVNFPGGELRGQTIPYFLQRFLGGRLSGTKSVPANASTGTGTVIVRYNTESNFLELIGDYQGIATGVTVSHIHLGAAGVNGGVAVNLINTGGNFGTVGAEATLSEANEAILLAGNMYVNIHSNNLTGGEIRTQLEPTTAGEAQFSQAIPTGLQENPAAATTAVGLATVLVDKVTGQAYVTSNFQGLVANSTASHLHRGAIGINGGVVMNLTNTASQTGTASGSAVLAPDVVEAFINGLLYINIHSSVFPGGEIRGQLGNVILPVKLGYFQGVMQKKTAILSWEATTEVNVKQYDLMQQNTNSGRWEYKTTVFAKETSPATYKVEDVPVNHGLPYINYRLHIIDKDGAIAYSPVVKLNLIAGNTGLVIAGNPATNTLNFRLDGWDASQTATVTISDLLGRAVRTERVAGSGNQRINLGGLGSGVYFLKVQSGTDIQVQRFVKQ